MGDILIKILKQFKFAYAKLRNCINNTFEIGKLPDCLKMPNITLGHKNNEPTVKENYRRYFSI